MDLRPLDRAVAAVGRDIERLKFNTAISALMDVVRWARKEAEDMSADEWRRVRSVVTSLFAPFAPHLAEELWARADGPCSVHQQPWPTFDVPVAAVRLEGETGSPIFALDDPSAGKGSRPHDDDALVNGRVPLGEGEWAGAPRARCIDRSPMAFATAQLGISKPLPTPEGRTGDVETAHLAKRKTFRTGKVEAHGGVIHHFANRLRWEIEPASRWVWSYPALHLVEILLDVVRRERLTVLKAYPCAQVKFERMVIQPACIGGQGIDDSPVLVHADGLFHRVPGNK